MQHDNTGVTMTLYYIAPFAAIVIRILVSWGS
jgi:hypothetical protein